MIKKTGKSKTRVATGRKLRLKPHNSFDLIRLIAHGQSDARKAVAELVQNGLDAGARNITITRQRRRGEVVLSIVDDGSGVFPDIERDAALERLATNIGHSFKRNLSVAERQQQMLLGKYGIGLLGFWSIGREFEMRTSVAGSPVWCLHLVRDKPTAEVRKIAQSRLRLEESTWTEVLIRGVHPGSLRQLSGRRLGEYLGSELRGQLLSRDVKLRMLDRLAQRKELKDFLVVPSRYQGRRVQSVETVEVDGFYDAELELYFVPNDADRHGVISLCSGGTVVSEDLASIDGYGIDGSVWFSGRLEGIVEFPDLEVAPTTRREFVRTAAADRLFEALRGIESTLRSLLDDQEEKRRVEEDENVAQAIRKIFLPLTRELPQYDFFDLKNQDGNTQPAPASQTKDGAVLGRRDDEATSIEDHSQPTTEDVEVGDVEEPPPELLPPGPLCGLRVVPRKCRLLPGATRLLVARPVDETGRVIDEGVKFSWTVLSGGGVVTGDGERASFTAISKIGTVSIGVKAEQENRTEEAEAEIEVVDKLRGDNPEAGIPDPRRVFDPQGDWRSRVVGKRWEYNAAHPDYQSVVDEPKRRIRYLTHLFAKEIVFRNYGEPKDERLIERMVEVLTHIKRGV
jgi:hypothetical protein